MDLQSVYTVLLRIAKRDGWKVRHCRVPNDSFGDIEVTTHMIRVSKSSGINQRITTLAHELLGHGSQYSELLDYKLRLHGDKKKVSRARAKRMERYQWYIVDYQNDGPYSAKLMRIVEFCEVDASKRAKRELIKLFPETKAYFDSGSLSFDELGDVDTMKAMREGWKRVMFKDCRSR